MVEAPRVEIPPALMKKFGFDIPGRIQRRHVIKAAVLALRKEIARQGLTLRRARRRRWVFEMADGEQMDITSIEVRALPTPHGQAA